MVKFGQLNDQDQKILESYYISGNQLCTICDMCRPVVGWVVRAVAGLCLTYTLCNYLASSSNLEYQLVHYANLQYSHLVIFELRPPPLLPPPALVLPPPALILPPPIRGPGVLCIEGRTSSSSLCDLSPILLGPVVRPQVQGSLAQQGQGQEEVAEHAALAELL